MSLKEEAQEVREQYEEQVEGIDEMVEVCTTIADQMLDKHGDKLNALVAKMLVPSISTALTEVSTSGVPQKAALVTAQYVEELEELLESQGWGLDERLQLICAALSSRR